MVEELVSRLDELYTRVERADSGAEFLTPEARSELAREIGELIGKLPCDADERHHYERKFSLFLKSCETRCYEGQQFLPEIEMMFNERGMRDPRTGKPVSAYRNPQVIT